MSSEKQLSPATVKAMRNVRFIAFDFDGVFTDNMVYISHDGIESVRCSRSDGFGLRKLDQVGVSYVIISTETNAVVAKRAEKLKIRCFHGCEDKVAVLEKVMREAGVTPEETAFVGNDINDIGCLRLVGMPIVVQDAYPEVIAVARHRTQRKGGDGAVREICDLIAELKTGGQHGASVVR